MSHMIVPSTGQAWTPARNPLRLALLGQPGAGKGTQGKLLEKELGLICLGVGQLLREEVSAGTALGEEAAHYMQLGQLVPAEIVVSVLRAPLIEADRSGGYVLDGYPRTASQASNMERDFGSSGRLEIVLLLEVDADDSARRLASRSRSERRFDDVVEIQRARIRVHREEVAAVVEYYEAAHRLIRINGSQAVSKVAEAILAALDCRGLVVPRERADCGRT